MNPMSPTTLTDSALLDALRALVRKSNLLEADLIEHLAEVDARRLHLERAHPSLFSFCTCELGFSESTAYNRIVVARAAQRFPASSNASARAPSISPVSASSRRT